MNAESIELSTVLPATPAEIYAAWLDSAGHTAMTGGQAATSSEVGAHFKCWGPYITGHNHALEPTRRIVQAWRTLDFPADAPDSELEVILTAVPDGTRLDLVHRNIPPGQGARYLSGWQERYFTPMAKHFTAQRRA